ncbi:TetR/AcrR family transcriptional regulator [Solimonas terrae]|uniref:TetR/AcrR family transcriptional regulator n=1 Tax=Solimonas terrae TaxID=1396819 RepID=A0A6M2BM16_9GAMM|nr:TetR/AcrR family transcriptional regulator [Solimonas terrae]NGY03732.1 TetR/AcrR family transcriptional regulator [Solimonas terrae]
MKASPAPGRRRTRRASLSRERIEQAALALIDDEGLDGFSTRKLGQRLGCEAMSIYHHYPSKAHLFDALVDRIVGMAEIPAQGLDPIERIAALARGWRAMALRHPRFYPLLSVHRMNSAIGVGYLEAVLRAFDDAGLDRETAARMFRVMGYFLAGAALDEISGYAKGPSSMEPVSDTQLARDFPHIASAGAFFSPANFDKTFEFGLRLFLDQLRLRLPSPAKGRVPARRRS